MNEPYDYGIWPLVLINIGIFAFFVLSYLRPKKVWEWRSMGVFAAFIVALFSEMYGFPLTIYALTSILGTKYPAVNPFSHASGNLWAILAGGSAVVSGLLMFLGGIVMFIGLAIMSKAWKQIHQAKGEMVTSGLYDRMRHPQYSGLLLITIGMLIQWPTIITAIMWPVLMMMYYRLALREERDMEARFGEKYSEYRRMVPMLFPRLNRASPVIINLW